MTTDPQNLSGEELDDAGRDAGHPRSADGKPWSEQTADEKRETLASGRNTNGSDEDAEQPPSLLARVADDVENGRLSVRDALLGLLRAGDAETEDDAQAAFYPSERDDG